MINRKNLAILADWLENNTSDEQFDMEDYLMVTEPCFKPWVGPSEKVNRCNTVGCALGNGSFCPELAPAKGETSWGRYCYDTYGFREDDAPWVFLFSQEWADSKYPTRLDAVNRIRHVVDMSDGDLNVFLADTKGLPVDKMAEEAGLRPEADARRLIHE